MAKTALARATCLPSAYIAPSVKQRFLEGAIWVDPAAYDWNARTALEAAMDLDRAAVDETNKRWMNAHPKFQETMLPKVYSKLAMIVAQKAAGQIDLEGKATRERLKDEY